MREGGFGTQRKLAIALLPILAQVGVAPRLAFAQTSSGEERTVWRFQEGAFRDDPATWSNERAESPKETEALPREIVDADAGAPTGDVQTVEVRGRKRNRTAASQKLTPAEVRNIPGAFGDPFRAIEILPGVSPVLSGFPFFFVRGAPPNTVGYMLDGIRVPYLFHVGLGPSVIPSTLAEGVEFFPGAFPAEWGRFAGAIVTTGLREPRERFFFQGALRPIDLAASTEVPFANGKGHAFFGTRVAFAEPLLSAFAPGYFVDYRDYQARVAYDLSQKDRLTVLALGSYDFASQTEDGEKLVLFASEFHRAEVRWDRKLGKEARFRAAFTLGADRTRVAGKRFGRSVLVGARAELVQPVSRTLTLQAGTRLERESFDADLPSPWGLTESDYALTQRYFGPHVDTTLSLFGEARLGLPHSGELRAGLRGDGFFSAGVSRFALGPRVLLRAPISEKVRFVTSHGLTHQPPAFSLPVPAVAPKGLDGGLQISFQSTLGAEFDLPQEVTASVNIFRNQFRNIGDFLLVQGEFPLRPAVPVNGRAYGLEISAKRKFSSRLGAILSYTLSRSERDDEEGNARPASYDRTHVFNAAASYDLGRAWRIGARILYYSGVPLSSQIPGWYATGTLPERLPGLLRFDARVEKRWTLPKGGWVSVFLEGMNAFGSRETRGYDCTFGCVEKKVGPAIIPSLGVEGGT